MELGFNHDSESSFGASHQVFRQSKTKDGKSNEINLLRKRNEELSHLVDVLPNGVVVLDNKGQVSQANKVAIELLGVPLEGEKWRTIITRSFKPRSDDGHEVSLYDGRRVKLDIMPLQSGQLIVMTDLTETRKLQDRISHLQRVSALGRMVASLAHQIRTPLSAAMLYAANLSNSRLPTDKRKTFVGKLTSRLVDLEKQVNDMLMFAKSGENQVLEQVSMQQLLADVYQSSEALVAQNGDFSVELPEPDICILANKTSLASAITNLVHNAVQVIGKGVDIHLSARRINQIPNQVCISVEDNGPGIKPEQMEKIFEPFFTTRSQGTGLGLSVVKTVAQAHQGRVEVINKKEGGAIFNLYLPIKLTSQTEDNNSALENEAQENVA
ncbi:PAS domain-containing protein [Psychrosphaera sp. F3M07]|nr:PAS domain-containing protein [Psychrosphaera sp. F3M07]